MRACTKCGETKPLSEFPPVRRGEPKLQTWCRDCFAAYGKEYYRRNRDAQKARLLRNVAARRAENHERMLEYLVAHPCVDCGAEDPVVLQFDHLSGKTRDIAAMLTGGWTWAAVLREIEKCEVRCVNCHRLKTALRYTLRQPRVLARPRLPDQLRLTDALVRTCRVCALVKPLGQFPYRSKKSGTRHWVCLACQRDVTRAWYLRKVPNARQVNGYGTRAREKNADMVDQNLASHPCVDCGEVNTVLLDFDHLRDKSDDVASMIVNGAPWEAIAAEIEKCEVRCGNCHARRTARQLGSYKLGSPTATRARLELAALTFVV